MVEQKGLGSNAYWWTRLKKPDTLRPYLRIAEGLKIPMPLQVNDYEYDPNAKPIKNDRSHIPMFFKPWNSPCNITRARNVIAEHLARNELSLQWYIKDCDLIEEKKEYESKCDVYSWNDWDSIDIDTNSSWKNSFNHASQDSFNHASQDSWWKDPNERTAWHSKTVAAMRARSAAALRGHEDAVCEQADIIARLRNATFETPNEQINDLINHLSGGSPRTHTTIINARNNAKLYDSNYKRPVFIDNSLIDNQIKSLDSDDDRDVSRADSDASGHYENEGDDSDDSRHFDRETRSFESVDTSLDIYETNRERIVEQKTRAERYADWCQKSGMRDDTPDLS